MWEKIKKSAVDLKERNGAAFLALLITAYLAVPAKLLLFYNMMGITVNFFAVWLLTLAFVYLLFASFRNKWIPAILFFAFSFLMFADAAYSSFFNRYLSINMLGAAGELGGVQESVREVLKLKYFVLFGDSLVIFATLAASRLYRIKNRPSKGANVDTQEIESVSDGNGQSSSAEQLVPELQDSETEALETETLETEALETEKLEAETLETQVGETEMPESAAKAAGAAAFRTRARAIWKKAVHPFIACMIIVTMLSGASGSYIIASAANQEFFSYHIKDFVNKTFSNEEELYVDPDDLLLATGTYENEIGGPLFGIAKGRNLIVIQMESMQNFVVDKEYNGYEITPNLNELIKGESIYFDNYFEQRGSGNTSDAEFATNNSLYGTITSYTYDLYADNYFKGLPWLLKEQGYSTAAFHGYEKDFWSRDKAYPGQGFDRFYSELDFDPKEITGMGIDDADFFDQSIDYLMNMKQPFYGFMVTLSNHYPFAMPDKYLDIPLKKADQGTIFGNYINSAHHADQAIGQLIEKLKDEGLYDNSIIAIYGDHFGLTPNEPEIYESVSRFLGQDYDFDTMMNVPLIIHVPGSDINQRVGISGGQMDFLPTIAYLLGLEKLDTLYFGHNLLTADSGFVAEQAYMTKGSFIQDDVIFEMSKDGVFENSRAWNFRTGKPVAISECKSGYLKSKVIIESSEYYLKNDVLRKALLDNESASDLFQSEKVLAVPDEITIAGAQDEDLAGTNSLEALDASYKTGSRYIKVRLDWLPEGKTMMLAKNGFTSLSFDELAGWMRKHDDAFLVVEMETNMPYLLDGILSKYADIQGRVIPEVTDMDDYTRVLYKGFSSAIFGVRENKGYTKGQILDFIELNPVWAASLPADARYMDYSALAETGRPIFKSESGSYELE